MSTDRDCDPTRRYPTDPLVDLFREPGDPGYAEAATRRSHRDAAGAAPVPSWRRRVAAAARAVILSATGFLLAVAYHQTVTAQPGQASAHRGLVEQVKLVQGRTDALWAREQALRAQVDQLRDDALGGGSQASDLRELAARTGLAKVRGDGAVVRLSDGSTEIDPNTGRAVLADEARVLDVDLQDMVNALWSAGAEAIAINGQRLTGTSTIRAAGHAVLVDFRPVTSPYEVAAIGGDDLVDRVDASGAAGAMRALADQYGIGFTVRARRDLTLPAATDVTLRYATPVTSAAPSSDSPSPTRSGE